MTNKYNEDIILKDLKEYLDKTYGEHYKASNLDCFDIWLALGDASPTFRNTAIKYLYRYGRKNGNNKLDLFKTIHYCMLCLYNDHYKETDELQENMGSPIRKNTKRRKRKNVRDSS